LALSKLPEYTAPDTIDPPRNTTEINAALKFNFISFLLAINYVKCGVMTAASARPAARLDVANTGGSRIDQDMMLPIEF
jgi:hypothetical protein